MGEIQLEGKAHGKELVGLPTGQYRTWAMCSTALLSHRPAMSRDRDCAR